MIDHCLPSQCSTKGAAPRLPTAKQLVVVGHDAFTSSPATAFDWLALGDTVQVGTAPDAGTAGTSAASEAATKPATELRSRRVRR